MFEEVNRGHADYGIVPIENSTEIFQKYEEIRRIDRLYVAPEDFEQAEKILIDRKL